MYLVIFVGLVLFMLCDLNRPRVNVMNEVDGITIDIENFSGDICITLDY